MISERAQLLLPKKWPKQYKKQRASTGTNHCTLTRISVKAKRWVSRVAEDNGWWLKITRRLQSAKAMMMEAIAREDATALDSTNPY